HIYNFITFARKYTFINNLHLVSENTVLKYGIFPFYFTVTSKNVILYLFTVIKIKNMKSMFMQMVIEHMHNRRYAKRSIELYSKWVISFIRFNDNKHPS
ncbi:phage integrase N-terminal SAM-like domain-containing protein, partial [Tenacibaculum discolor]